MILGSTVWQEEKLVSEPKTEIQQRKRDLSLLAAAAGQRRRRKSCIEDKVCKTDTTCSPGNIFLQAHCRGREVLLLDSMALLYKRPLRPQGRSSGALDKNFRRKRYHFGGNQCHVGGRGCRTILLSPSIFLQKQLNVVGGWQFYAVSSQWLCCRHPHAVQEFCVN